MHTANCPLCGLRYRYASELAQHVREEHAPPPAPERHETIVVPSRKARAADPDTVLRQP